MKNKSKLKKIKEKKNTGTNVPAQWLYLCPQEITVRDIWTTVNDSDDLSLGFGGRGNRHRRGPDS